MNLNVNDRVGYQGVDYRVDEVLAYALADRTLVLVRLAGGGQVRFLEPAQSDAHDRVLVLSEIANLAIATPPPTTLYHGGESYLLRLSGTARVTADHGEPRPCTLWRYRAAGDQFLQIEHWPDRVRTLAGASVHLGMLEMRPATRNS